jgi:hypothetical protein
MRQLRPQGKQAANEGSEASRDETCDYGHRPVEHESDESIRTSASDEGRKA